MKTIASLTLQINKWISAILLSICLAAAIFDLSFWQMNWVQFLLLYSAMILLLCSAPYLPVPILQILTQLIGDLLQLNRLPAFLQAHPFLAEIILAVGTLLLWLPTLFLLFLPLNEYFIFIAFLFLVFWILFFRALEFSEQQKIILSDSLQELEQKQIQFWAIWLLVLSITCIGFLLPLLPFLGSLLFRQPFSWNQRQQFWLTTAAIILCFTLLLGILYKHNTKQMRAALEKMQLQHQLAQNQQYIDLMTQKYQTLRQYQHDFKKHLAYIQQLARQNEASKIDTYIHTVYADLQSGTLLKLTGNQTLDILLSDRTQQAQKQAITFEIDYQPDVNLSSIADLDLCVILGNLLDNALAAAAQSTERKIYCSFGQKNQYYSAITIINSCDTTPAMKNGIPQRQTPSEQHGCGVQNVLNRAQKYGGHCQFVYHIPQKQFQATVLLSCAEKSQTELP